MGLASSRSGIELQNILSQRVIYFKYSRFVPTTIAVIRGGKYGDELFIMVPGEPIHHQLVCSYDKAESVDIVKLVGDILSECVPCTSRRNTPSFTVLWVTPHEVANRAFVWDFLYACQCSNMVEIIDRR